jgi:hypothetical protein
MKPEPNINIDAVFEEGTPIDEAIDEAFRAAVEKHRQLGLPLVVWRDGKIVEVMPDEIDGLAKAD